MPKRSAKTSTPDFNEIAYATIQKIIAQTEADGGKNPVMQAMGRIGGRKGGKRRSETQSAEDLSRIGRMGAAKRWGPKS